MLKRPSLKLAEVFAAQMIYFHVVAVHAMEHVACALPLVARQKRLMETRLEQTKAESDGNKEKRQDGNHCGYITCRTTWTETNGEKKEVHDSQEGNKSSQGRQKKKG